MLHSSSARAALLAMAAALSCSTLCASVPATTIPTGCRDTCAEAYGPTKRSVVRLADGCSVRITWSARPSCVVGWDIAVLRVEPLTDACAGMPAERLVNEATDSLITTRETGLWPMAGFRDSCVEIGRIRRAACWGYQTDCGDSVAVPCDSSSCCESVVLLCTDEIFRRRIVRSGSVLRARCDPRWHCESVCTGADSSDGDRDDDGWRPGDTLAPYPGGDVNITARSVRRPDGGPMLDDGRMPDNASMFDDAGAQRRAWPWRDVRPLRSPIRELREPTWRFAVLAGPTCTHRERR